MQTTYATAKLHRAPMKPKAFGSIPRKKFALPPKRRAEAAEVIAKKAWAAAKDDATEQGESATEQPGKPTKRLKRHDDGDRRATFEVFLSQRTAKAMADGFF